MALENANRGNQMVGPKGSQARAHVSTPETSTKNPDTDPAPAKRMTRPTDHSTTRKNRIAIS